MIKKTRSQRVFRTRNPAGFPVKPRLHARTLRRQPTATRRYEMQLQLLVTDEGVVDREKRFELREGGLWVAATTTTSTLTPTTTTTTGLLVNSNGTSPSTPFWIEFCSVVNFTRAYEQARKDKWSKEILDFDKNPKLRLVQLIREIHTGTYRPQPLKRFVLRDPKTRIISKSAFKDRIVHHAIVQTLQPRFEPVFIYDSYASRKGKSTLLAVDRFEQFTRKTSKNYTKDCFVLKCDITKYFDTVDHEILLTCIAKRASDKRFLALIRSLVENHASLQRGKGVPLGNWTSQFFANIYLNELDQYVKHELKVKQYIRYVDDFVIVHHNKKTLERYRDSIDNFLRNNVALTLHPSKCRIIDTRRGAPFLGFRVFPHHRLLVQRNIRKARTRLQEKAKLVKNGFKEIFSLQASFAGWNGYAKHANTYRLRKTLHDQFTPPQLRS